MFSNTADKHTISRLNRKRIFFFSGLFLILIYLLPIFGHPLYVLTFDNLDMVVPSSKILTESGKIFASNSTIIPNMMHGLPRLSYGSEFNMLLWLYYFFDAEIAFRINFFLIHIVAFLSMYLLLDRYFYYNTKYRNFIITSTSLFFAILPFYSGAGLTTSALPLLIYILLNIRNGIEKPYEWILLILIPFYSSFIMMYIFIIFYLWIIFFIDSILISRHFKKRLFFALLLITALYALTEYRLFLSMFSDPLFVSHRTEFDVYFCKTFRESHLFALKFFLDGWAQHQQSLMMPLLLPLSLMAMIFSTIKRKFTETESMLLWIIVLLSIVTGLWHDMLTNKYTLILVTLLSVITIIKAEKFFKLLGIFMLLTVLMSVYNGLCSSSNLAFLKDWFPILNQFNIARAVFFLPLLVYAMIAFTLTAYATYLKFFRLFLSIVVIFQFYVAFKVSRVSHTPNSKYMTFEQYYAPTMFNKIKKDLHITSDNISQYRFVEYGIEPSVALYNNLYTVDGYSTNYPLSYKHKFGQVQEKECFNFSWRKESRNIYKTWGSKAYLFCIKTRPQDYTLFKQNNLKGYPFYASPDALCNLEANYIISGIKLKNIPEKKIVFLKDYNSTQTPWHLWIYKLNCKKNN